MGGRQTSSFLLALPDDVVSSLSLSFLSHRDVARLKRTCSSLTFLHPVYSLLLGEETEKRIDEQRGFLPRPLFLDQVVIHLQYGGKGVSRLLPEVVVDLLGRRRVRLETIVLEVFDWDDIVSSGEEGDVTSVFAVCASMSDNFMVVTDTKRGGDLTLLLSETERLIPFCNVSLLNTSSFCLVDLSV